MTRGTLEWVVDSKPALRIRSQTSACVPKYISIEIFESGEIGQSADLVLRLTRDEAKRISNHLLDAI